MSISLQLLCLRQMSSTVVVLEKQTSRWSVWFKYCHCKQLFNQKSDWLQMILCHTERLLTVSVRKLYFQTFSSVRKLCSWAFLSVSLCCIVVSTSAKRIWLFSVWSKMFKSLICSANKYLVNFMKNQKRTLHLSCMRMKFWKKQIMYIYFIKKWFEISF